MSQSTCKETALALEMFENQYRNTGKLNQGYTSSFKPVNSCRTLQELFKPLIIAKLSMIKNQTYNMECGSHLEPPGMNLG
jgi:hypothetical protein